jgi:hypothetical protein
VSDLFHDFDVTAVQEGELPYSLALELVVYDRDVVRALAEHPDGEERNQFALEALKIGILALRHVGGQFSADLIQRESTRLIGDMQRTLQQQMQLMHGRLGDALKEYFDPESGRFDDRVRRLVGHDGELSQLIRGFIDGENSQLARTMFSQISPLMKHLDPRQSEGLLAVLRATFDTQLTQHRDHVLKEFSLDYKEGALCRLVNELTAKHGDLNRGLQEKIDAIVKEFSLNEEGSALSRLVNNVTQAQRTITDEFSLDSETSCLSRLKRELVELLAAADKKNQQFQEEVKISLATIMTSRREAERSTRHGVEFEAAVSEFLAREAQRVGDILVTTAHTTGLIKNCKVGDCVVELGPDSVAPGAKVVVEAKEEAGYTLARAREEIETARNNRGAEWGVFVFSKKSAPSGLEPFQRYGNELVVVWDVDDTASDVFLKAGILAARALCFRAERQSLAEQVDFKAIDMAINEIEKRARNLEEIRASAETIQSSSTKILDRIRKDRDALDKQIEVLREKVQDLRDLTLTST